MKRNSFIIIGITGGIATGKSTISQIIKEQGYTVIDSDEVARDVVSRNSKGLKRVIDEFGENLLNDDGTLDRVELGNVVFNNEEKRELLNKILHPLIRESLVEKIEEVKKKSSLVFVDIPLLFESRDNLERAGIVFQEVWLAYINKEKQIKRLMKRNDLNFDQAVKRIESQLDIEEKRKLADEVIDNSGDIENTRIQVLQLLDKVRLW